MEKLVDSVIKEKQKFERLVVPKETLLEMFAVRVVSSVITNFLHSCVLQYNKYKRQLIESKIPDGTSTTVYRCGPMIDLCVGPHIPHTGKIKSFLITKVRSSSTSTSTRYSRIIPRTLHRISLVTQTTTRCSESTVFLSPTRRKWLSTSTSWRRLRNEIIERSER